MNVNIMLALGIMWKGMLGIFVVMGILALVVYLLTKVGDRELTIPPAIPLNVHMARTERSLLVSSVTPSFWARDMRYKNRK